MLLVFSPFHSSQPAAGSSERRKFPSAQNSVSRPLVSRDRWVPHTESYDWEENHWHVGLDGGGYFTLPAASTHTHQDQAIVVITPNVRVHLPHKWIHVACSIFHIPYSMLFNIAKDLFSYSPPNGLHLWSNCPFYRCTTLTLTLTHWLVPMNLSSSIYPYFISQVPFSGHCSWIASLQVHFIQLQEHFSSFSTLLFQFEMRSHKSTSKCVSELAYLLI